jgi:hypothetical protein
MAISVDVSNNCRAHRSIILGLVVAIAMLFVSPGSHAKETDGKPGELEAIDGVMDALYDVVSGPAGTRDWDRMRSLFAPGARLMAVHYDADGKTFIEVQTIDELIEEGKPYIANHAFYEDELAVAVEQWGNIAHAWSTYATRKEEGGEIYQRGINSAQLMYDGVRWWIVNLYWAAETPDTRIPEDYLE